MSSATAAPILLTTTLTGDPRPDNPDNLRVLVSIVADTLSNIATFTVDLDMAAFHPNARLDEFGFNLLGAASNYSISGFNLPYTPISGTFNGSGSSTFLLTLNDPSGNAQDATNLTSLTFQVTRNTGNFTLDDFLQAPSSCSNDLWLTCSQMGAHLQGLNVSSGESDSGVAFGSIPEPGTLMLMSMGIAAAAIGRRRR